ncbi:MAG TPA: 3-phosphoshikimate 1-carboxyvinyltransferase [Gaiellaceae bacterium]|jgi:3-phosphoshikimate 1-carboxyvinyltransferase|nr:3-phosphoshikimate 1-carboxyvinyltransferase [Gaiellaceae bacterium]
MRIEPAVAVRGDIAVPGDKSISHRALLLGAIADGESEIDGFAASKDTLSTVAAVRALGAGVEVDGERVRIAGAGLRGLREPAGPLDCGNAGTLMRLLPGILAGQEGRFELVGDESLSGRPMERIAEPLRAMGGRVETTDGHAPLAVEGGALEPVRWELPVASAQVKSCVLLAGLYADGGPTVVVEGFPSRDHTERMLESTGARVRRKAGEPGVWPAERLRPLRIEIPGDFSSAAPFVVAATLLAESELRLHGVGINPTRTGFLAVLERMGARVSFFNRRSAGGEPVADLEVEPAELTAAEVRPEEVPGLVDELPLFALAAGMARGESVVTGAEELRVKESDRLESVKDALRPLGIHIETRHDGFRVRGVPSRPRGGGVVEAGGDHRIAMLGAIAGLVSREGVELRGAESAAVSFPDFFAMLDSLVLR